MAAGEALPVGDALTSEVEAPDFPAVRIPMRYVIQHSGRDYILADGLLHGLHALSGGHFDIETKVEQLPNEANGLLAVASARVTVFAGDETGRVLRASSGIGDASPQNVGRMMIPHLMRMAETRAKARALRDLLNISAVSFEELGPAGGEESPTRANEAPPGAFTRPPRSATAPPAIAPPAGPAETIFVDGRTFTRPQIESVYQLRLEEAKRAGLGLGQVDLVPVAQTPLAQLVEKSRDLKRRLEARASAPAGER